MWSGTRCFVAALVFARVRVSYARVAVVQRISRACNGAVKAQHRIAALCLRAVPSRCSYITSRRVSFAQAIEEQLGDKVISSIKEVDDEDAKFEAMGPGMMDIVWDRIDSVRHLVVATLIAYLLGYLGFHLFWVAILFYFVYSLDASYKLRGFQHFFKLKKLKVKESGPDNNSEESAKWFNFLMLAVWPNISNRIAVETKRFMVGLRRGPCVAAR